MRAELIAIGDELTSGQWLDTNSAWISRQLADLGIPVAYHTTVGDDVEAIAGLVRAAVGRSSVIIANGGLGPTADDVTRHAVAAAAQKHLIRDDAMLEHIRALFARRGRVMPESNAIQADFPEGSRPITNPHGTAPGIRLELSAAGRPPVTLYVLPGVPAELQEMWAESVLPDLTARLGPSRRFIRHRLIHSFGRGESDIERMLPAIIQRDHEPLVGITANQATVTLRVTASGASPDACHAAMDSTVATIQACLGNLVYGEGDDQLHDALNRALTARNSTLATAEMGTGGLIMSWMSGTDGKNPCFRGGLVIPTRQFATRLLGTEFDSGRFEDANEGHLVAAMASNVRDRFEADYGLAVGPFPRETSDASHTPACVHYAFAGPDGAVLKHLPFATHPAIQRMRSAKQAVNLARLALLGSPE